MSATAFKIEVGLESVSGFLNREQIPGTKLDLDKKQLAVDVVELMDRWLNFWQIINESRIRHKEALLHFDTFKVMGEYLWELILNNPLGDKLVRCLDDPKATPLHVSLTFAKDANETLRGLPWEFLYHEGHGFLATRTQLLLTRYVPDEKGLTRMVPVPETESLGVLLVAAFPQGDREFDTHRLTMGDLKETLHKKPGLEVRDFVREWDESRIRQRMSDESKPCHIVHVMGICKGPPGKPLLYLGGESGFTDPQPLVDVLTKPPVIRPRLVILHLCDDVNGDATENFERLGPSLINEGVPAVLALQYAAATADDVGVGESFYRSLAKGEKVGEAVQASRQKLAEKRNRMFGTPVLYLGDDGQVRKKGPSGEGTKRSGRGAAISVRKRLAGVVNGADWLEDGQRKTLLEWVKGIPEDRTEAAVAVSLARKSPIDKATEAVLTQMLKSLRG